MKKKNLELYIHIPFCIRKCAYCDFLSFTSTLKERTEYVKALLVEIEQYREVANSYRITSIFIGGGTPSILEPDLMICIMEKLKDIFQISKSAEISVEVNPGTMTLEKAKVYKNLGINRVSIGLQATSDEELRMLGRIHDYQEFLETYEYVKNSGIHNINIDLISAIPKQTVASWTETLNRVIALNPTHISAYSLIIEEGTKFHDSFREYEEFIPEEDAEREMYYITKEKLEAAGYVRYEISNYAKDGYECQHNLGYWERKDYLGIGLGAASLLNNVRYTNESEMEQYIHKCSENKSVHIEKTVLSIQEQMEEFMFLGLRKMEGIRIPTFREEFGVELWTMYGTQLDELIGKELLEVEYDSVKLTELGIDVSNYVLSEFV